MPLTRRKFHWEIKFAAQLIEGDPNYFNKLGEFIHSLLLGYFLIKSLEYNPVEKKYIFTVSQRKGHELLTKEQGADSIRNSAKGRFPALEVLK